MVLAVVNITNNKYNWKYDNHNDAYLKCTLLQKVMTSRFVEPGWKDDEGERDSSLIQFSFSCLNITLILLSFDSLSHPHHSSPTLIHLSSCLIRSFFIPPLRSFFLPSHLSLTIYSFNLCLIFLLFFSARFPHLGFFIPEISFPFLWKVVLKLFQVVDSFKKIADHFTLQK